MCCKTFGTLELTSLPLPKKFRDSPLPFIQHLNLELLKCSFNYGWALFSHVFHSIYLIVSLSLLVFCFVFPNFVFFCKEARECVVLDGWDINL